MVWAALETFDARLQYQLLRELATVHALSAENPRTKADKVRAGIAALRGAAELLGHPPAVKEYRAVRIAVPELRLPPDASVRRWLGGGWNECLRRALLDTLSDGDFASRIGDTDRFDDDEVLSALRECTTELGHAPTSTEYFAWAGRPDVRERPGRRPRSYRPFERLGGIRNALEAAGIIAKGESRYSANGRVLPLRFRYSDNELADTVSAVARRLGHSPTPGEYDHERQRIHRDLVAKGETPPLPSVDIIRKRHGSWNGALRKAGLDPVERPSQPHLGTRRPSYNEEEKLEWIRRAWVEVGQPFTAVAYKRWRLTKLGPDQAIPCLPTIERTFGGWRNACARAVPSTVKAAPKAQDDE
jgi:hypothetical protein